MISARGLHKEPIDFKPQFKIILLCNFLPKVTNGGGPAVWRRIRNIKFISSFVDNPNKENPNEYKIDTTLTLKMDVWKAEFMNILLDYNKKIKTEGLNDIPEIMKTTSEYQNENNPYIEFADEYIVKFDDRLKIKANGIEWVVLCDRYKKWLSRTQNFPVIPKDKEIKAQFEKDVFHSKASLVRINKYRRITGWQSYQFSDEKMPIGFKNDDEQNNDEQNNEQNDNEQNDNE